MELLIIFVLAMFVVVLYTRTSGLRDRVAHIERYLQEYTRTASVPAKPLRAKRTETGQIETMEEQPVVSAPMAGTSVPIVASPDALEQFIAWCKEDLLMKLGGLLMVLGCAWFVSYAVAEGWIGEMGRIFIGIVIGYLVMGLGWYRMKTFITQGSILMVTGAAVVILTFFAARELYDFFDPVMVLTIMFFTSSVLGLYALTYNYKPLAYANVCLAAIAPLLTNSPHPTLVGLMSYLLVLSAGAVWVAVYTGWRELVLISLGIVFLYSISFASDMGVGSRWLVEADAGLLLSFVFTGLYFVVSLFGMQRSVTHRVSDLVTALASGAFLLMWVMSAGDPSFQSLYLIAWTLLFALGAYIAVRRGAPLSFFYSYVGTGVVLLGVATSIELSGPSLTVAFIIEAALVLLLGYTITRRAESIPLLAVPSIVPLFLALGSVGSESWNTCARTYRGECVSVFSTFGNVLHADAFVLVLITLTSFGVGAFFALRDRDHSGVAHAIVQQARWAGYGIAGLFLTTLGWLVPGALSLWQPFGTFASLFVYTLVAAVLYLGVQNAQRDAWKRTVAGFLFGFVVMRLLFVDVWNMELGMRVVTFIVIGCLLMFVAWVERNRRASRMASPTV